MRTEYSRIVTVQCFGEERQVQDSAGQQREQGGNVELHGEHRNLFGRLQASLEEKNVFAQTGGDPSSLQSLLLESMKS